MKEILKIRYQIYILMKKVVILRKMQVTMKAIAPPFFNHFSLSLNPLMPGGNKKVTHT